MDRYRDWSCRFRKLVAAWRRIRLRTVKLTASGSRFWRKIPLSSLGYKFRNRMRRDDLRELDLMIWVEVGGRGLESRFRKLGTKE